MCRMPAPYFLSSPSNPGSTGQQNIQKAEAGKIITQQTGKEACRYSQGGPYRTKTYHKTSAGRRTMILSDLKQRKKFKMVAVTGS